MKELDSFTVERLEELSVEEDLYNFPPTQEELNSLARIALAAKRAEPVCYADRSDIERIKSGSTTRIGSYQTNVMSIALYTTPQPAHTEQVNHPMQPLHIDEFGTIRFKANAIVQYLLDVAKNVGVTMNTIAMEGFKPEDEMQFAQPIGYSLSGYGELSYVTNESYERASAAAPEKPL